MLFLNNDFVYRKIHEVNLLIPIKKNIISDDTIFLNETAALIFQLCNRAKNAHTLALLIFEKFIDADREEVLPELESYIQELISEKLIIER